MSEAPELADVLALVGRLAGVSTEVGDRDKINWIAQLEQTKAAVGALQARMTAAFEGSQRASQRAAGVPEHRVGGGVAAQLALARRESPGRARRYVGWARVLVDELPRTFAALERGETSEWRSLVVAKETIWLTREHRNVVDEELAGRIAEMGDRRVESECRRLAYRLDPRGFVERSRAAASDRRVSLRPAPDTMARLSAFLPVAQGVAAYAALSRAADTARAIGDARGRGQVMADTLVECVTGQAVADGVPVEVSLVMTDQSLFGSGEEAADRPGADDAADGRGGGMDEPGHLVGYGPIPAGVARDLARGNDESITWLRRLWTDPSSGQVVAMDSRRRVFEGNRRHAIIVRDQWCRTPWCDAPIRHTDHVVPVAEGGETTVDNGQGLCEGCNYAKQALGWTAEPSPGGSGESVTTTTPTGHSYTSHPPGLPGRPMTLGPPRAGPSTATRADDHAA